MGTSSSYAGPSGRNPLLPPWADDSDDEQNLPVEDGDDGNAIEPTTVPPVVPQITWRAPKRAMGLLVRGAVAGTAVGALHALGRAYVNARGGSGVAASGASAGRATTTHLGGFLSTGMREGFGRAVENLGLQALIGQDVQTVLAAFADLLAPDGALLEQQAARRSLLETLEVVFERYDVDADGIEALDRLDANGLGEVIRLSVVNYVDARMEQELASRIERGTLPDDEANRLMDEIHDFIDELVKLDFADVDLVHLDWDGLEGRRLVLGIYQDAYRLLGDEK